MKTFTCRSALALLGLVAVLQGCTDESSPTGTAPEATAAARQDSAAANRLARGLAAALADDGLRRQILEDMRDSPAPDGRLHLQSYLRGTRGSALARAAAASAGMDAEAWLAGAARLPQMEIYMPLSYDRAFWEGSSDVIVSASPLTQSAFVQAGQPAPAYTTTGETMTIYPLARPSRPVIALLATTRHFGADPEAVRAAAPRGSRKTVSTRDTEFFRGGGRVESVPSFRGNASALGNLAVQGTGPLQSDVYHPCMVDSFAPGCEEYWCQQDPGMCPPPYDPHAPTEGIQLLSQYNYTSCTTSLSPDADNDGIRDDCEAALAVGFEPTMRFSVNDGGVQREPWWSVRKGPNGEIHIFYLISYYRDYGSAFGVTGHWGDGEFIILRVVPLPTDGRWAIQTATLSAHWDTYGESTATHNHTALEYYGLPRGEPLIWVAHNKHANYNNIYSCDAGSFSTDTCDNNYRSGFIPMGVIADANIGNAEVDQYGSITWRRQLRNCVGSRRLPTSNFECFWTDEKFAGWQVANFAQSGLAGGYRKSLRAFGF